MEREGRGRTEPPWSSQRTVARKIDWVSEEFKGMQLKASPEGRVRRGREPGGGSVRLSRREAKEEVWERVRLKEEKSTVGAQREAWGRRRRAGVEGEGNRRKVRRVRRQLVVRVGATFEEGRRREGVAVAGAGAAVGGALVGGRAGVIPEGAVGGAGWYEGEEGAGAGRRAAGGRMVGGRMVGDGAGSDGRGRGGMARVGGGEEGGDGGIRVRELFCEGWSPKSRSRVVRSEAVRENGVGAEGGGVED